MSEEIETIKKTLPELAGHRFNRLRHHHQF